MVPNQISTLELIQAQVNFIPEGWKLDRVGNVLAIKNTFRKPISQEVRSTIPGNYPYYGPTKIQGYISEYEQDGTYALIGEDGDHFLKYATMRQTQFISGKCTVNNHAHIIDSTKICDSEWFYIFFKHRNITNFLSRQGAGRFKLNKATLEKLPLLVPPVNEQRKIAKILSAWDKAINTTERLIDNRKQQKKALMQQLLTGKKRLLDDTKKLFNIDWKEVALGEISFITTGSSNREDSSLDGEYAFFDRSVDVRTSGQFLFDAEAVIIPGEGQEFTPKHFKGKFDLHQRTYAIMDLKETIGKFIYYYIDYHRHYLLSQAVGSTVKSLRLPMFKKMPIMLPEKNEQKKISIVLTNTDKEMNLLEQKLAYLKQEKQALMQQLLTGKCRVKVDQTDIGSRVN
jgi:type I restriction enzyme S subunit